MIGSDLGPYRIVKELGTGGMGKVYEATVVGRAPGIDEGTQVALKIVHSHLLETPGFFKRFLREADIGKSVSHANVVRTFDADALRHEGEQLNFLVMEYVAGQTLRDLKEELGRVPEELCRHVAREVASGLAAIHAAGVVHRDLKPENVLITEKHEVKVMDLGVARLTDEAVRLSQSGAFIGSLHYAAPEQFTRGGSVVDHRADLHALGLVLYELATGTHPYDSEDFRKVMHAVVHDTPRRAGELNPQLSPFFEEVLGKLLAKDPDERFATTEDLIEVLTTGEDSAWWHDFAKSLRLATKQPLRRIRLPRETDLWGRDPEIAKMRALFEHAKAGEGRMLLVQGEAGIGKTRLVDEFAALLRQEGEDLNFLFGSYPPGGAATAAGAYSTAYREHLGEASLEDLLAGYLATTPVLVPAFAALLRGEPTPTGQEPLTKDSIHTCFVHATRGLAAERPTIVLIDDLHFAPEEGRALFAALGLAIANHRILLVGTTRPGLSEEWVANVQRHEHAAHFELARLGPKDLVRLLKDAFRSERLADAIGMRIAEKSDGNPFFVFEIIRGLREHNHITQTDDGSWVQTGVIRDIKIPSSVMDLIEARIAALDEGEKDLLEVASCCGFEFDPALVAEALGLGVLPALKSFARIEKKHRLIQSAGRRFVFDHHQVQESLYAGVFEQIREHYHAAIADALEKREGAADGDVADVDGAVAHELCRHFLAGRQGKRALRYLDRAIGHLAEGHLHAAVGVLADAALSVRGLLSGDQRIEVILSKAKHLGMLGHRDEQRVALEDALALADPTSKPRARARILNEMGTYLEHVGLPEESRSAHTESLELARRAGDRAAEGKAVASLGILAWTVGRFGEARELLERSAELAGETGDRMAEARSSAHLALAMWDLGRTAEARKLFARQMELAGEGVSPANAGELEALLGNVARAEELLERARSNAQERGNRRALGGVLHELGDLAEQAGALERAEVLYRSSLELAHDVVSRYDEAETRMLLGRLLLRRGDPDAARKCFERSRDTAREIGRHDVDAIATAYMAHLPGESPAEAEVLCEKNEEHIGPFENLELRYVLWRATQNPTHLEEAHRRLQFLRDHAPEEYRDTMIENVPLHRDIVAAWKEHGSA